MTTANGIKLPKSLLRPYKVLRISLAVYIICELLLILSNTLALSHGSIMLGTGQALYPSDFVSFAALLGYVPSYLICIIFFCIFSFRAAKNLELLKAKGFDMSPSSSFLWYFVPIANLWKPYGKMVELWESTDSPDKLYGDIPTILPTWWGFWIIGGIISNISWRMSLKAGAFGDYVTDIPLYKLTLKIDLFASAFAIVAAVLLIKILTRITKKQELLIKTD